MSAAHVEEVEEKALSFHVVFFSGKLERSFACERQLATLHWSRNSSFLFNFVSELFIGALT